VFNPYFMGPVRLFFGFQEIVRECVDLKTKTYLFVSDANVVFSEEIEQFIVFDKMNGIFSSFFRFFLSVVVELAGCDEDALLAVIG